MKHHHLFFNLMSYSWLYKLGVNTSTLYGFSHVSVTPMIEKNAVNDLSII